MRGRDDAKLLVVDIDTWGSDVAKQYAVNSLPAVWVYEDGERVTTDLQQAFDRLAN